jgi:hypothetical protein
LKSQGTRKIKELAFCREEDKKTTFETPFLFPCPSSSLYAFPFLYNNFEEEQFNTQVIIENQAMINM